MARSRKTDGSPNGAQGRPDLPVSRRTFLRGAVAASAAAGAVAWPANLEGGASPTPWPDAPDRAGAGGEAGVYRVLTPVQGRALAAVLNRIIPPADVMPGAGDAGIARFVDGVLADAPHLRRRVVPLLDEADTPGEFAGLSGAEQDARLQTLARQRKPAFDTLLRAAYTGYYSDSRVLAAIGRGSRPGGSTRPGTFDTRRLDAVRKRGPIYRDGGRPS